MLRKIHTITRLLVLIIAYYDKIHSLIFISLPKIDIIKLVDITVVLQYVRVYSDNLIILILILHDSLL